MGSFSGLFRHECTDVFSVKSTCSMNGLNFRSTWRDGTGHFWIDTLEVTSLLSQRGEGRAGCHWLTLISVSTKCYIIIFQCSFAALWFPCTVLSTSSVFSYVLLIFNLCQNTLLICSVTQAERRSLGEIMSSQLEKEMDGNRPSHSAYPKPAHENCGYQWDFHCWWKRRKY